jgi:hypothetical protein
MEEEGAGGEPGEWGTYMGQVGNQHQTMGWAYVTMGLSDLRRGSSEALEVSG